MKLSPTGVIQSYPLARSPARPCANRRVSQLQRLQYTLERVRS